MRWRWRGLSSTARAGGRSALQILELVRLAVPFVGVGRAALRLVMLLNLGVSSALSLMKANWSLGRSSSAKIALAGHSGHADGAVNALVGVDHEHVRAFAEAVHGAYIHAIGVFTLDAVLDNDVGHGVQLL